MPKFVFQAGNRGDRMADGPSKAAVLAGGIEVQHLIAPEVPKFDREVPNFDGLGKNAKTLPIRSTRNARGSTYSLHG